MHGVPLYLPVRAYVIIINQSYRYRLKDLTHIQGNCKYLAYLLPKHNFSITYKGIYYKL